MALLLHALVQLATKKSYCHSSVAFHVSGQPEGGFNESCLLFTVTKSVSYCFLAEKQQLSVEEISFFETLTHLFL